MNSKAYSLINVLSLLSQVLTSSLKNLLMADSHPHHSWNETKIPMEMRRMKMNKDLKINHHQLLKQMMEIAYSYI